MFNWDDIRVFVAVAEAGSTEVAARALGMDATTLSRRLKGLERDTRLKLFDRDTRGHVLTAAGEALLPRAKVMAAASGDLARDIAGIGRALQGTLRITCPPSIFAHVVAPVIASFRVGHPDVGFEIASGEQHLDLTRGEADIAIRATDRVEGDSLTVRKLTDAGWGIFCSRGFAAGQGQPRHMSDLGRFPVIGYQSLMERSALYRWFLDHAGPIHFASLVSSIPDMAAALQAGLGVGTLPHVEGSLRPDLVPCFTPPEMTHAIWLVAAPGVAELPAARQFIDHAVATGAWFARFNPHLAEARVTRAE